MLNLLSLSTLLASLAGAVASAGYDHNLNYRSPYANQPGLGLDTKSIQKRQFHAGDAVRVAAQKRGGVVEKRQAQTTRPSGTPSTYTYSGYGKNSVADWGDATYIYAGGLNYTHGVASGDPYDYSVLLWTRAVPSGVYRVDVPMCVQYNVYEGANATGPSVSSGYALSNADVDFTFKVEATGLKASTAYSYQFSNCVNPSEKSPIGQTRTAPGKMAKNVATQRFAIYSCSNYPNGFFSAYSGPVVHSDADYVVHLGDYIYESGTGGAAIGRTPSKNTELATLDDYRKRYAQYRSDVDLRSMHQALPIIAIWDDHETADNDWKAGSTNSNDSITTGGCAYSNNTVCFSERAVHAKRAYHEWIPIRQVDLSDEGRIWRDFRFGDLLDIMALDTRKYDRDITDVNYNRDYVGTLAVQLNSTRSITGPVQEKWLLDTLSASAARKTNWRLIMNQVIFGSIAERWTSPTPQAANTYFIDYDAWDGYQGERDRILKHIDTNQIDNTVVFTGDTHAFWAFEITPATVLTGTSDFSTIKKNVTTTNNSYQRGQVVEYGGTAVSSSGWGNTWLTASNATVGSNALVQNNGGLLYSEGFNRGYMNIAVNYTHLVTSYYGYPGNQQARVPGNRTLQMQFVQASGMNMIQRPLMKPTVGAIKAGN